MRFAVYLAMTIALKLRLLTQTLTKLTALMLVMSYSSIAQSSTCSSVLIKRNYRADDFIKHVGKKYFENDLVIFHSDVNLYFYYKGRIIQGAQRLSFNAVEFEQFEGLPKYMAGNYLAVSIDPYLIDSENPDQVINDVFDQYEGSTQTFTCVRAACYLLNQIISRDRVSAWTMDGFIGELFRLTSSDGSRVSLPRTYDREFLTQEAYLDEVIRQQSRWLVEKSIVSGVQAALFIGTVHLTNQWVVLPLMQAF